MSPPRAPAKPTPALGKLLASKAYVTLSASDKRLLLANLRSVELATRPGGPPQLDHRYDWAAHARPDQREPLTYGHWLLLGGRGAGKTRTAAETTRARAARSTTSRPHEIAVIGRTATETRDVCFESKKSGLLAVIPPEQIATYNRSLGNTRLVLTNGTTIRGFSGEEPDSLAGNAFDFVWLDEYALFSPATAAQVLDQVWFCLREAEDPAVIISTTPRRVHHIRTLVRQAETDPTIVVTRASTWANAKNLSATALQVLKSKYAGTRLGRQELEGELLDDVEGAMVTQADIDIGRVIIGEVPSMAARVTAVDPATTAKDTSDLTGIVTVGVGPEGDGWVWDDASGRYTPDGWARAVWAQVATFGSQAVVVEDNAGGDMVETVLLTTWRELVRADAARGVVRGPRPPIARVTPSGAGQGKWARAQPISLLYQQHRIHHVSDPTDLRKVDRPDGREDWFDRLASLEDQATTWRGQKDERSPDRVDALVHGLTWLLFPAQRKVRGKVAVSAPASHRWTRTVRR